MTKMFKVRKVTSRARCDPRPFVYLDPVRAAARRSRSRLARCPDRNRVRGRRGHGGRRQASFRPRIVVRSLSRARARDRAAERAGPALHRRAGRRDPRRRPAASFARRRSSTSARRVTNSRRAGAAPIAFHPQYRRTAASTSTTRTRTATRGSSSTARTRRGAFPHGTAAVLQPRAVREPQRRAARVRPERAPLRQDGRRRLRRRPREPGAEPVLPAREAALAERQREGRRGSRRSASATRGGSRSTANGDLYIGDVGQGEVEEINYTPRISPGLENYGWDVYEGTLEVREQVAGARASSSCRSPQYPHDDGCSVTGGFVYRGSSAGAARPLHLRRLLQRDVWSLGSPNGKATGVRRESFKIAGLSSFGRTPRASSSLPRSAATSTASRRSGCHVRLPQPLLRSANARALPERGVGERLERLVQVAQLARDQLEALAGSACRFSRASSSAIRSSRSSTASSWRSASPSVPCTES